MKLWNFKTLFLILECPQETHLQVYHKLPEWKSKVLVSKVAG